MVNSFISEDKVQDRCEILKEDPKLIQNIVKLSRTTQNYSGGYEFPLGQKELAAFHMVDQIMVQPQNFVYFIDYSLEIIVKCDASLTHIGLCVFQYLPAQKRYISAGYFL